jgi:hypothetical protein
MFNYPEQRLATSLRGIALGLCLAGLASSAFATCTTHCLYRAYVPGVKGAPGTPSASLTSYTLNFGSIEVGSTTSAESVQLNNTGTVALGVSNVTVTGPYSASQNCGVNLAAGASCAINVTFTPTAEGSDPGNLSIATTAGVQSVALTGIGLEAMLAVSPSTLTFGNIADGQTSTQSVTLTNSGNEATGSLTFTLPGGYTQTNTCGSTIAAGASCTATVTFAPTAIQTYSGNLSITAGSTSSTVALSGTGLANIVANGSTRNWSDGTVAASCNEYFQGKTGHAYSGATGNGVYRIQPSGTTPFDVTCDMTDDGGGWTVFQQRNNGAVDFYQTWAAYAAGFGTASTEYWLGNDRIAAMTASGTHDLRISLTRYTGDVGVVRYTNFKMNPASDNYRLASASFVSAVPAAVGDSLSGQVGYLFSTKDVDNDTWGSNGACAVTFHGAWWFGSCFASDLNGQYVSGPESGYALGEIWYTWTGYYESLPHTAMMVR